VTGIRYLAARNLGVNIQPPAAAVGRYKATDSGVMHVDPPRKLTSAEHALLKSMLERGGCVADVDLLRVVDVCECGCSSFELARVGEVGPTAYGYQIADAYGKTSDGRDVGLILWGTESQPTLMELYSLASEPPFDLPRPETIVDVPPWPEQAV
jgi:hypothetical protein